MGDPGSALAHSINERKTESGMRILFAGMIGKLGAVAAASLFALLVSAAPAAAQNQIADPAALDDLFVRLHNAGDEAQARSITDEIWEMWLEPVDPVLNGLMYDVLEARQSLNLVHALGILDRVVTEWPEYAEGWNQRATIYFMLRRYQDSLDDIIKVLEFEPRHFGALSGRSLIYRTLGDDALALQAIIEGLKYHPFLVERQFFPQLREAPVTNI